MTIKLRIDNLDRLPDGGPLHYASVERGFSIGRNETLDWTLPDPSRFISGKHCEVRFEQGGYWLTDVSTNGTFLNGSRQRMKSPYRICDGDRIGIGHYVISASVEEAAGAKDAFDDVDPPYASPPSDDIWGSASPAPAPIDRRELMAPQRRGQRAADFSQEFLDIPDMRSPHAAPFAEPPAAGSGGRGAFEAVPNGEFQPGVASDTYPDPYREAAAADVAPNPAPGESFFSDPRQGSARGAAPMRQPPEPARKPSPRGIEPTPDPPGQGAEEVLRRFAVGAGLDPQIFADRDPGETAEEIGRSMRVVVEDVQQLLKARQAAKVLAKSSKRTMLGRINNPLKFLPSPEEILEVMFTGRRAGYLAAVAAFEEAFGDLKRHEMATYAAMQTALARLLSDLSPEAIEGKVTGSAFTSKKARNWEMYVTRWEAKTEPYENGMLDVFLTYFAEAYDEGAAKT